MFDTSSCLLAESNSSFPVHSTISQMVTAKSRSCFMVELTSSTEAFGVFTAIKLCTSLGLTHAMQYAKLLSGSEQIKIASGIIGQLGSLSPRSGHMQKFGIFHLYIQHFPCCSG